MLETLLASDRGFGLWLASWTNHPWVDAVMITASFMGARGSIWIVLGLVTWAVSRTKRMAVWRLLLAVGLAGLLVDGITKPIVGRARPWIDHPEYRDLGWRPDSTSFPSGHAASAAAGALALARIWPATAAPAWALAALIAFSRVALGVHFPSDVIVGFLIGILAARFVCARPPDPAQIA
jgi:undecaprenyl-diphosphatase